MLTAILACLTAISLTLEPTTLEPLMMRRRRRRLTSRADGPRSPSRPRRRRAAARGGPRGRGDMGSGWGSTITITQDAARLTVEYAFFSRGDMQPPLKFVYALDGSETKNSVMMGRGIQGQTSRRRPGRREARRSRRCTRSPIPRRQQADDGRGQTECCRSSRRRRSSSRRRGRVARRAGQRRRRRVYRKTLAAYSGSDSVDASAARTDPARSPARADSARSSP